VRKPVQAAELFRVMGDLLGLRYRHEKNHRSSRNANRLPDAKAVRALPEELRQSLRDAAEQLDVYAMNQIIGEIRNSSEPLAASLEALVGEFRFDLVLQVLQAPPLRER